MVTGFLKKHGHCEDHYYNNLIMIMNSSNNKRTYRISSKLKGFFKK